MARLLSLRGVVWCPGGIMFDCVPDYPMAVTAATGPDRTAVQLAVEWLRRTTDEVGGQPLVYGPNRSGLRQWPILTDLSGWAVVSTWKSFGSWSGGAVLAAWPDAEHLAKIADDPRTRALCVLPGSSPMRPLGCGRIDR